MTTKRTIRIAALLLGLLTVAWFAIGGNYGHLNFNHPLHVADAGIACEDCHAGIMDTMLDDMIPVPNHDTCEMCHDVDDDCETCHVGDPMAAPAVYAGTKYTTFAHGNHGDLDCAACHGPADEMEPGYPTSESCQGCHEDLEVTPTTHRLETWVHDHGMDAMMSENDCAACHTQNTCDECHQGENILANTPHPPEWRFSHSLETMYGQECLSCHETRDDCIACHRATVPTPHPLGPTYANNADGGEHVDDASAFLLACLACHDVENQDPVCARCHQ